MKCAAPRCSPVLVCCPTSVLPVVVLTGRGCFRGACVIGVLTGLVSLLSLGSLRVIGSLSPALRTRCNHPSSSLLATPHSLAPFIHCDSLRARLLVIAPLRLSL